VAAANPSRIDVLSVFPPSHFPERLCRQGLASRVGVMCLFATRWQVRCVLRGWLGRTTVAVELLASIRRALVTRVL
jgi:hypothetical protein